MRKHTLLYLLGLAVLLTGVVLQFTHVLSISQFYYLVGISLVLGTIANRLKRQNA